MKPLKSFREYAIPERSEKPKEKQQPKKAPMPPVVPSTPVSGATPKVMEDNSIEQLASMLTKPSFFDMGTEFLKNLPPMTEDFVAPQPKPVEESSFGGDIIQQTLSALAKPKFPSLTNEDVPMMTTSSPKENERVKEIANSLAIPKAVQKPVPDFQKKEIEQLRNSVSSIMQKINTLSMGGGGTGSVKIADMADFDYKSYSEGRYLRWIDGMFRLDEVNPHDVIYNTTVVSANYTLDANDYYLGVTTGPLTVTLPSSTTSGRTIVIKDETGNAQNNNITISGNIDNDANGVILAINNGAVQLLFRNGWRII